MSYFSEIIIINSFLLTLALVSNLNPPRKKAKQMRLERRQAKLGASLEQPPSKTVNQGKTLRDFLTTPNENNKHQLKVWTMYIYIHIYTFLSAFIVISRPNQVSFIGKLI